MPYYSSKQKVKSGVPLGGIGAGKFELTPCGTLDYLTFRNNWSKPIENKENKKQNRACGIPGFHFALYINTQAAVIAKLLQTEKTGSYNTIKHIDYEGSFPFARLKYVEENLPVEIMLNAYSFFIPGDVKNSALPAAVFEFEIKNRLDKEIEAGLMFCGRNLISMNSVGRYNTVRRENHLCGIEFRHAKPLEHDGGAGDMFIAAGEESGAVSYLGEWNMQKTNFYFEQNVGLDAFEFFAGEGKLPGTNTGKPAQSQSVELGGALAVKFKLGPGRQKTVPFVVSWHFPRHFAGHYYERSFRNSRETAAYVHRNLGDLASQSVQLPIILKEMGLEPWLRDALLNNLYPLFSSSWLTRGGDFTMYEAPVICPLMGTLDVYFYASAAVGLLFPELDKKNLSLFRKSIRKNGYVPHDLGLERIDLPSNGTTIPLWKDLNAKFILLVYRAYRETQDLKFLKEMFPALKRALDFSLHLDKDGGGLPENEGYDTTFDTWGFTGVNSYTSGIFLVSLLAMKEIAEIFNDKNLARKCIQRFMLGQKSFEEKLWNGRFYITAKSREKDYPSCMVAQLSGQWFAYVLGLGRMFPEERIKSSIESVLKLNCKNSPFGAVNSVFAGGKRDEEFYHSRNIWPGVCYAFAALAIYEGYVKEGLALVKKVWKTISEKNKNPWNQPDVIIAEDGSFGFGDCYMRNMTIWSVLPALAAKDEKAAQGLEKIKQFVNKQNPQTSSFNRDR